jgi:two-component system, OmpR family, sensor kinase
MRFAGKTIGVDVRLALWFSVIMGVVLAALSLTVYQLTRDSLLREADMDVRQRAALIAAAQPVDATALLTPRTDVFSAPDVFVQVVDPTGHVLSRSSNLAGRTLPFMPQMIRSNQVDEVRVSGRMLILYGRPIGSGAMVKGYVLVARTPQTIYVALDRLRSILYPGAALALILAGIAGWLLVRRALGPLRRMSTAAARITATRDHTQRIGYAGPADEIGRLAQTIDGMLESLEQAHAQVQAAHVAQKRFLAEISHELRTPLTIMLSSLDLLARTGGADPDFAARALADMRVETDRMARMVSQLLIMARTDAGAAMPRSPVIVVDVLSDACRQLGQHSGSGRLRYVGLDEIDEAVVEGDADYLKQLFLILLDNAFKYSPVERPVEVSGYLNDGHVAISVADAGIGIQPSDLPHLFDRFYRGGNARARQGLGLGLAIAQRIAVQHGGRIDVQSQLGQGTRFTITLPLAAAIDPGDRPDHFADSKVIEPSPAHA